MGLKMVECDGEVGLPGSDGARLGLGIMRGDKDVVEGAADRDRARSIKLVGRDVAEEPFFRSHADL